MKGFSVIADYDESCVKELPVSSLTAAIGDLLELTAGSTTWAACTSSSNFFTRKAVSMQPTTSASVILAYELDGTEKVQAESANNSDSAHNGDRMLLTDSNTVNNAGSDNTSQNVCFVQEGTVGINTDKTLVGRVIVGLGVDPDAT